MSYQKCPICNGTGVESLSATNTNTQARCLVCDGRRIISTKTGLPPSRVSIEKSWSTKSKLVEDAEINYAAQEHVKEVIDELDKTGELPYHIRPNNALKRTDQEKEKIRFERLTDPTLQKLDEDRGRDLFENNNYIRLSEQDLKDLDYKPTPTQDVSHIQSRES